MEERCHPHLFRDYVKACDPPRIATWQDIRGLRARPPAQAARGGRREKTFSAALEQAEQLAVAAKHAGYATKPILLFYALGQGYRAVCAARSSMDWEPVGHGVSVPNRGADVVDVVMKAGADGRGLYQAAMEVVGEPVLAGEVSLRGLWASSPEIRAVGPPSVLELPGPVTLRRPSGVHEAMTADALFLLAEGLGEFSGLEQMRASLVRYPTLETAEPAAFPTGLPSGVLSNEEDRDGVAYRRTTIPVEMFPVLRIPLESAKSATSSAAFEAIAPSGVAGRDDVRVVPPAIGQPPQILGPLGTWWLLLLGLSSLARYHPATWKQALDVDRSDIAVGLERLLDVADESIPHYIAAGLEGA